MISDEKDCSGCEVASDGLSTISSGRRVGRFGVDCD